MSIFSYHYFTETGKEAMNYKKYLMIAILILTLIYPEYIFGGLAILVLIIFLIIVIADVVLDIYIVIALFIEHLKKK